MKCELKIREITLQNLQQLNGNKTVNFSHLHFFRMLPKNVELFKTTNQQTNSNKTKMKSGARGYCQNEVWLSIGIWVRLFIHVYTFGFPIFLTWHLKQQNRNVFICFPLFYLFGHIFNKFSSSETIMKAVRFLKISGYQGRVPFTHVSHTKEPHVSPLQHLLGESFTLNCLLAPHLASGRITFLGHSSAVPRDLIFLWWPGQCHPNMRRGSKLKSDTYWNETLILRRNSDLFSLTLELELNL